MQPDSQKESMQNSILIIQKIYHKVVDSYPHSEHHAPQNAAVAKFEDPNIIFECEKPTRELPIAKVSPEEKINQAMIV
jgi:hypothetical protein